MNACRNALLFAAFVGGAASAASTAKADDWSFSIGGGGHWVEPVYEARPRTIIIPAQYEDRTRQVWREPVYQERRTLVTIPPRTEIRMVPQFHYGRFIGYDRQTVVVESGRQEWRTDRVLVEPGRWETVVDRVLIEPERTEVVYDQVLVSPGYWAPARGISFGYVDHDDDDHHRRPVYIVPRGGVRVRR